MHRLLAAVIACAAISSSGCTSGFDTESAFSEEAYLCNTESAAEWQAAVDTCRDAFERDESCRGVVSFQGELQGVDVVMDATLEAASFQNIVRTDLTVTRSEVSMVGFAPYFGFELTLDSVGGVVPSESPWPLVIGPTPDRPLRHVDAFAQAAMRLSAGTDSADLNFASGTVDVELQEVNEIAGRFALRGFSESNDIEGCFHAFDPEPEMRFEGP
jgi:hypothetical protein